MAQSLQPPSGATFLEKEVSDDYITYIYELDYSLRPYQREFLQLLLKSNARLRNIKAGEQLYHMTTCFISETHYAVTIFTKPSYRWRSTGKNAHGSKNIRNLNITGKTWSN